MEYKIMMSVKAVHILNGISKTLYWMQTDFFLCCVVFIILAYISATIYNAHNNQT